MPKKVFLMEWSSDILIESAKQLKAGGVEIVYWLSGAPEKISKQDFPTTIIHNTFEALKGVGALEVDSSRFEPLSEDLISKLYQAESRTLFMMQRFHFTDNFSPNHFNKKKFYYYQYLKYWNGVLRQFKPDVIIFATTPHMVCDFVVYSLAKLYKIKTIMFDISRVPGRLVLMDDIFGENKKLKAELANKKQYTFTDLSGEIQNYYKNIADPTKAYYPFKDKISKRKKKNPYIPKIISIFQALLKKDFLKKCQNYFKRFKRLKSFLKNRERLQFQRLLKKEYEGLQKNPDLSKKFVVFPLQYQPERTTSPLADMFSDQILIAEIVAASLPLNWVLYIKEHPFQWISKKGYMERFLGFYKCFTEIKNVQIIPLDFPTKELMAKSQAVVTATGTCGWEAAIMGKPSLVFGWPFYRGVEGVFSIGNIEEAKNALLNIQNGYKVNRQEFLNYFSCIDKTSVKAYLNSDYASLAVKVPFGESVSNITSTILKELETLN